MIRIPDDHVQHAFDLLKSGDHAVKRAAYEFADKQLKVVLATGHKTLAEVERYTRAAEQRRLAQAAMKRVGRTDQEREASNLPDPTCLTGD